MTNCGLLLVYLSVVAALEDLYLRKTLGNCRKSQILRLSKVFRLKHVFQARYLIMVIIVNYIPRFDLYISNNVFKDF